MKDSIGNFHVDLLADKEGKYFYRSEGTCAVAANAEGQLTTRPTRFA